MAAVLTDALRGQMAALTQWPLPGCAEAADFPRPLVRLPPGHEDTLTKMFFIMNLLKL